MDVPDQFLSGSIKPADSLGNASDVCWPKPNFRWYESMRSAPSFWPSMIVPMLDEFARMSVRDMVSVGCGS